MTKVRHTGFARMTQKDVSAAAARHEMLYSGRIGGGRAVFAFCDLSGLDLSGRNLADADFTGAILEEANLEGAKLDAASLFGADLRRANLAGASLRASTTSPWASGSAGIAPAISSTHSSGPVRATAAAMSIRQACGSSIRAARWSGDRWRHVPG